jgi:hypothetical protein
VQYSGAAGNHKGFSAPRRSVFSTFEAKIHDRTTEEFQEPGQAGESKTWRNSAANFAADVDPVLKLSRE